MGMFMLKDAHKNKIKYIWSINSLVDILNIA